MKSVEKAKQGKNLTVEQEQTLGIQEDLNLGSTKIEKEVNLLNLR